MAKRYSSEWKKKVSEAVKKSWEGRELSDETREKLSLAAKARNKGHTYKHKDIKDLKSEKQRRLRLIQKRGSACERCGWNVANPYHNIVPTQINHIDGNSENNNEENLEILCPNCHSLTQFFMCFGRKPTSPNARTLKRYNSWKNKGG